jgi:predicted RNase H-like HicB family nuclease
MTIQQQVLEAARRLCRERGNWTFTPDEIVRALPHLVASSVRTHVTSRCCVNAPAHHAHRWPYFRRVRRGVYEITPQWRKAKGGGARRVAEPRAAVYRATPVRDTVHAFVGFDAGWYFAECAEVAVVTQGRTLDELLGHLGEAVSLHLEGEEADRLGVSPAPRLVLTYETRLPR